MKIVAKYLIQVYSGGTYGLDDFSVEIDGGDFVTVLGESGCGKTTLLRVLAGLEKPVSGELYLDGVLSTDIPLKQRKTSFVFQEYVLYPKFTVWENVRTALERYGLDGAEETKRIKSALKAFDLIDVAGQFPRYLSGGQQQRVALAKAVVTQPELLLFDEPMSNVAEAQRAEYIKLLKELKERLPHTTFVYVTHNVREALTLGNKLLLMRSGRALQYGDTEFVSKNPQTLDALQMLYEANVEIGRASGGKVVCDGREINVNGVSDGEVTTATVPFDDKTYVFDFDGRCLNVAPERLTIAARFDGQAIDACGAAIAVDGDFAYRYIARGREFTLCVPVRALTAEKRDGYATLPAKRTGERIFEVCGRTVELFGDTTAFDGNLYFDFGKADCEENGARALAHYRVYESGCTGRVHNGKLILPCGAIPYDGKNGAVRVTVKRCAPAQITVKNGLKFSCMAEDDCGAFRLAYCRLKGFDNYATVRIAAHERAQIKKARLTLLPAGIDVTYL